MTMPLLSVVPRSSDPVLDRIAGLSAQLERENVRYDNVDRYYTGDQPLAFLAPEIEAQVGGRIAPLIINWPEVIVDSVARRLHLEGFRLGQGGEADDELWRLWTANDMDEEMPLGIVDGLVHGVSFLSVWGNDEDPLTPRIGFESAHQVTVEYEPGGRAVRSALKRWTDGDREYATLYLADRVLRYSAVAGTGLLPQWQLRPDGVLPNPLGVVPIVPMVNKGRTLNRGGRSELASVAPIADGIVKLASDMMVTAEFYVTPRRYVTGMQPPDDPAQRERYAAEMRVYWEEARKSKMLVAGDGAAFGQFPEATLDGFVASINLLTAALAAIGGLPPDDLGLNTTNPASAEARRAAETTLILRANEKQTAFGKAAVRALQLAVCARDGIPLRALPQDFKRMQAAWREAATPALAQSMDAATKGLTAGLVDVEAGQALIGLSPVERAAIKARADIAATAQQRAQFALAEQLAGKPIPLTPNAALATAGLLQAAGLNSAETPRQRST